MPGPTRSLITPRRVFVAVGVLLLAGMAAFEIERASLAFMRTHPGEPAPSVTPPSNAVGESSDLSLSIVDPPTAVPALLFVDGYGRAMTLADFRGRVVLLNVWATWCVPCRKEMPTLDRLEAKLGGPDFQVIALSIDRQGLAVVKPFYQELGLTNLGIAVDESGKAAHLLHAVGVPLTLLIDREGREVARKMGPAEWDSPEMTTIIRRYLEPQPGAQPAMLPVGGSQQRTR